MMATSPSSSVVSAAADVWTSRSSQTLYTISKFDRRLTPLLAGRAVEMSGQHYCVQQEPSVPPGVKRPSVLVATLGPQILRLASELADSTALGAQPWT